MRLSDIRGNAPTYRFWGKAPPKHGADRQPIVDLEADVQDGVAVMRLYDPIDSWGGEWGVSAKEFAQALDSLPDDTAEIRLHINSPGGEVFEAIALMNLLRSHKATVTAVVDGIAASAASFLAASADTTVMGQNAELMIHDAWGLVIGNAADMHKMGDTLDHLSDNIASVYAAKSGASADVWREAMRVESWYSADEAVAAGLADSTGDGAEAPKDKFDLTVFAHAGREAADTPPIPAQPEPQTGPSQLRRARHRMTARRLGLPA